RLAAHRQGDDQRRRTSAAQGGRRQRGLRTRRSGGVLMRRSRGFSLLEVMVAIAILGLVLTVILSAQGGLAASNRASSNMGNAVSLGRCKMSEIEEKMLKLGYPEIDQIDQAVPCCDEEASEQFT